MYEFLVSLMEFAYVSVLDCTLVESLGNKVNFGCLGFLNMYWFQMFIHFIVTFVVSSSGISNYRLLSFFLL